MRNGWVRVFGGNNAAAIPLGEVLSRPGDREAFVIKEAFDLEYGLDILAAVEPMPARAFHGLQRGKFGFPEAEDESLCSREAAHFPDPKKALFGDFTRGLSGTSHGLFVS